MKLIFFFPGTVLHETTHYVAALLLGKAEGFSVIPRREGDTYVLGSVRSKTRYKVFSSFIAIAPLIWWLVPFLLLGHVHFIGMDHDKPRIHFGVIIERLHSFTFPDALLLWLSIQMLWAGRLSLPDIKNVFRGLLSVSGFALLGVTAAGFYLLHHVRS